MNNKLEVFLLLLILLAGSRFATAQQTLWYSGSPALYREATELFNNNEYGAAKTLFKQYFEKYAAVDRSKTEAARYYSAMSSVALKDPFALEKLNNFATRYPESSFAPSVHFAMANLYFDKHKYTQVLEMYAGVSPSDLTKTEKLEYFYKEGFSYLKKNQLEEALNAFSRIMNAKGEYASAASFYYAHIQYQKGNFDKALKAFKAIKHNRKFKKLIPAYLMHIYYQKGNYQKVIEEGEKFFNSSGSKNKADLARMVGNAYYELGDFKNALTFFIDYERSARHSISADEQYRIAYTKFRNEKYQQAIANFQKAITGETKMAQNAWYYLGFCYQKSKQPRFAQKAFLSAYKIGGKSKLSTEALFAYAKLTIEQNGDPYNDPVAILQGFIDKKPPENEMNTAYNLLVQLYLSSKNNRAALQSIEKTKHPNRVLRFTYQQLSYAQAVELYNRSDFKDAIDYFSKSLKFPVDNELEARALFWKADAFYRLKQFGEAEQYYRSFLSSRGAVATGLKTRAYYNLAYSRFNRKQYAAALTTFKQFISFRGISDRMMNDAILRLADSYFMLQNYDQAISWYSKAAIKGKPDADYALYQKAFCYSAKENYQKKINTLQLLVSKFHNSEYYDDALYEIATTYSALNDQRSAIVYFNKIVKERPHSRFAKKSLIKMGLVYYKNNQYDRAITTLKKVVNSYPASHEATIALNSLESIYKDKGQLDKYFTYAKSLDFVQVSKSEEDSLTFSMGEEQYLNRDCSKAISSLQKYLNNFPDGGFVLKAHFYLAGCFNRIKDNQNALLQYEKILEFPENDYTVKALLAAARLEFDKKNYEQANKWYKRLTLSAENKSTLLEAEDGVMRTAFLSQNYEEASQFAQKLLRTEKVSDDQIVYAHYILAESALHTGKKRQALREFNITDKLSSGQYGAEAKYRVAQLNFEQGKDNNAENIVYQLSSQYPDFEYWVAKGFILLSDIYASRKNYFQARETLKSIIANYSGNDLKQLARKKLMELPTTKPDDKNNEKNNK